jgi:TolA-binding protein
MKEFTFFCVLTFVFTYTVGHYGLWEDFQKRAETVHQYEYKALEFSKQLRYLKKENQQLKSKIAQLKAEKEHLQMQEKGSQRTIASIPKKNVNDLVNFDLYRWSAEKLLGVGAQALHFEKFDKSAQYYNALLKHYPSHELVNDKVLFEAGIAAYESKKHYDWAENHFSKIVKRYPRSKYYRGAKLWLALSHFYQGDQKKFVETVDEFRRKYRNTQEWKVLSRYYEDLNYKYKK